MPAVESSNSTSASLLARVKNDDPDAWARFARLYGPLVYGWARRAGLQDVDAADVMQDVFRTVAAKIAEFRSDRESDTFRGWMWTITRSKINDLFRRRARQPQATGGTDAMNQLAQAPDLPVSPADHSDSDDARLKRRALDLIRSEFAEHHWQAFWRTAVEGDAPADVADDLDISRWAVYQAKSRVLRRLRQELADLLDETP